MPPSSAQSDANTRICLDVLDVVRVPAVRGDEPELVAGESAADRHLVLTSGPSACCLDDAEAWEECGALAPDGIDDPPIGNQYPAWDDAFEQRDDQEVDHAYGSDRDRDDSDHDDRFNPGDRARRKRRSVMGAEE